MNSTNLRSLHSFLVTGAAAVALTACGHSRDAHITVEYASTATPAGASTQTSSTRAGASAAFETAADAPVDARPPSLHEPVAPEPPQEQPKLTRPNYDAGALAASRGFGAQPPTIQTKETSTPKTSDVSAAIGGAQVTGSVSNVRDVVGRMAPGFRACYERGLAEDPDARGSLRITVKIGANGDVVSTSVSGGEGLSGAVIGCIQSRAASARFSRPADGGATIVVPVSLQPKD